ncbi:MAG TPA: choice-of-anchor Q domain-containing protein, partial [Verrucomicrobiales bacterium]|nr:choice-of-anchor Q domain-containing protein [Verrucomicrobiales bacterium]
KTEVGSEYVFTYPALSPAAATTQIRAATFDPTPNLTAGGTTEAFSIKLTVSDSTSSDEINGNISVHSINDAPVLTLSFSPSTIPDAGESKPFRISIVDPDIGDESKVLTLTLTETGTAKGTLIIGTPLTGTAAQLQAAIQNVRYQPFPVEGSATAQFSCSSSGSVTATGSLTIGNTNDPPDIAGITTQLQFTTDDPGAPDVFPFKSVTITDPDFISPGVPQPLTATITLDDPARGESVPATITGTAQQLTQQLRLAKFVPKPNRVAVGDTETTILTLSVTDGTASKSNSQTKVATLSVNGAPAIVGIPSGIQSVSQNPPVSPFSGLSVEDDDAVPQVTITVTLDDPAKGSFTNLGGFVETPPGSRIYTFSGIADTHGQTVSPVTVALRGLTFVPNPNYSFPPNLPGYTTFTLDVSDALQNHTIRSFSIVLANASRNFLVTAKGDLAVPPLPGTLRYALANAKDNDVITFAFAAYPVVIRINPALPALVLTKHLRFKGPGADLLTISGDYDGNSQPDSRLFQVQATVSMEGLTLTQGIAQAGGGGAFQVGRNPLQPSNAPGNLTLSYCAVTDCRAAQWGGAIDVEEGSLNMDHCLLKGNSTDPALGLGGGAISLYTSAACSFTSTTFSGNRQRSTTGFGGGALYAENFNPQVIFPVTVTQCTFAENQDAAGNGSSIHSNVFNCRVTTRGSIFADGSQRNLHVAGSGQILSQGRNLSDDAARTTLIQGGQPQLISLLNQISDQSSVQPLLLPLLKGIGPTESYGLSPLSPAIGTVAAVEGTDQRGVVRDGTPDSGAVEFDRRERVVINEVQVDAAAPTPFIEFYIPRDSAPVDFNGMAVYIDNQLIPCHTFNASLAVQPGQGLILAQSAASIVLPPLSTTGVVQSSTAFWPSAEHQRTTIELRSGTVVIASASLVNV